MTVHMTACLLEISLARERVCVCVQASWVVEHGSMARRRDAMNLDRLTGLRYLSRPLYLAALSVCGLHCTALAKQSLRANDFVETL